MVHPDRKREGVRTLSCREIWGGVSAVDETVAMPGLDARVISRPHGDSSRGGDIHYLGLCGHGVLSRFVVADVSGHGDAVAEVAGMLRRLMSRHMDTPDQSQMVRAMNAEFHAQEQAGNFATAVVMSYLAPDDHLVVVNAGHPRPLWRRRVEDRWRLLTGELPESVAELTDLPLGVVAETGYRQFAVHLEPGDLVIVYTDPLIEAESPTGEMLGESGLLRAATKLDASRPETIGPDLIKAVEDFRDGAPLGDDVTVLALHHNGDDPPIVG